MPDLAFRMRAPLGLTLRDGTRTRVEEWSMRGVTVRDVGDRDVSDAVLAIPFQGVVISFPVYLEPGDQPDFFEFRGLNGRQRETLALFYRNLLSGKMASTADMITALDTPVDLIPMEETEEERAKAVAGRSARWRRVATALSIYTLLFVLIFGYLGNLAWNRLNHISLDQPRFIAPIETLNAPKPAFVGEVFVEVGQQVAAGTPLMGLNDPEAQARLDEIRFERTNAERALAQVEARLDNHLQRQTEARAPFEAVLAEALETRRLTDFLGGYQMSEVDAALEQLRQFDLGLSFLSRDYNDVLTQLRQLQAERRQVLGQFERQEANALAAMDALRIVAPRAGAVSDMLVQPGQYLSTGTELLIFEADGPRQVRGWLDNRFADEVFEGMPAKVIYNRGGTRQRIDGQIASVEAGMNPVAPDQYGMIITVAASGMTAAETRAMFPVNAPAAVKLDRGWFDDWLAQVLRGG